MGRHMPPPPPAVVEQTSRTRRMDPGGCRTGKEAVAAAVVVAAAGAPTDPRVAPAALPAACTARVGRKSAAVCKDRAGCRRPAVAPQMALVE